MLIDRAAPVLLVLGYQPFVSPRKDEVSEFTSVGPPRIAIVAEAKEAALLHSAKTRYIRRSHSARYKEVGLVCVESIRPIFSLNQGRVGLEIPDIIPAAKLRAANVPVESRICWLIGDPRFC